MDKIASQFFSEAIILIVPAPPSWVSKTIPGRNGR